MIQAAKHVLFMIDYDGTLTPIAERPELATLSEDTRQLLQRLVHLPHFTIGVISGRALADLKEKVKISGIIYAGNHGFEIEGPGWKFISPIADEVRPLFRILRQVLSLTLGKVKGVLIEDKGLSLSVHYRQVEDEKITTVEKMVERAVQKPASRGLIRVTPGKKVYEVKPAINWNKGKAIRLLMKKYGKGGRHSGLLPIYLGDDLTDEDGFEVINKYGNGIAIYVGEARIDSLANYYLRSPQEVSQFMVKLLEHVQRGF
jgi:trehalose 6-phosphate phosphatase